MTLKKKSQSYIFRFNHFEIRIVYILVENSESCSVKPTPRQISDPGQSVYRDLYLASMGRSFLIQSWSWTGTVALSSCRCRGKTARNTVLKCLKTILKKMNIKIQL
jgi:hypothetical protein